LGKCDIPNPHGADIPGDAYSIDDVKKYNWKIERISWPGRDW